MEHNFPVITKAKLILTEACQLRCKYCYEEHGTKNMDLATAKSIIDMLVCNGASVGQMPSVSFFGGEPLLVYEELMKPCIEYIRDELNLRCPIGFTTNGLLLDEDKLKYFREQNVTLMLSIDGCQLAHDTNRIYPDSTGSFSQIEEKIPLILKYFPNTRARMTITPDTVSYLYESVKYIADKGFLDFHVIPDFHVLPEGRKWESKDFEILKEQMTLIEQYIISEFEEYNVPLIFQTLADMFPRIVLADYCNRVDHYRTASCCDPCKRCGIGQLNNVIFNVDGSAYSCQHGDLSESSLLYLGNVETGILDVSRIFLLEMNKSPLRSDTLNCKECPLDYICTGGCTPNNYALSGDFTLVPGSYCLWTQQLYKSAVNIAKHFDEKKDNELFKDYFYGVVKRGVICVC